MGQPIVLSPWQFHTEEYAKENMKITEKRCDDPSCPCQRGFNGHRQSFMEIADDIERLKGETVVFLENGKKDDIIIDNILPHSKTNGRIVVFPEEQDDDNLLTQALFFSERTAEKLAKEECANDQWYGYDPKANDKRCYPRDKKPKHIR